MEGFSSITPLDAQFIFARTNGAGNPTKLGSFTVDKPHVVDVTAGKGIGTYTFTAANGDTLTAALAGVGTPTTDPVVVSFVETAVITGGTGRFSGATGNFILTGSFSSPTNLISGSFEGTISSPGASKKP